MSTSSEKEGQEKAENIFTELLVADGHSTEEAQGLTDSHPLQELAAYLQSKAPENMYSHYTQPISGGPERTITSLTEFRAFIPRDGWKSFIKQQLQRSTPKSR